MTLSSCLLCNRIAVSSWFVKRAGAVDYTIVRCKSCRAAYVWPRPEANAVHDLYADENYSPSHDRQGVYWPSGQSDARRLLASFRRLINGPVILDIGAGEGVAAAEAIRHGFTVRACEPSPQCRREFARRNGFEPESSFFDGEYARKNRHQIDAVLLSHVLEHLRDPDQLINDVSTVLRPQGVMIVTVPLFGSVVTAILGRRDFFITPPEHLTYFSFAGLKGMMERHGYIIESMYTSPKVNMLRYGNLLGPASYLVNSIAYGAFKFAELFKRSVVLNVCARRIR